MKEKSEEYVKIFNEYADNDRSIYKQASLASYYAYGGETENSIEYLKLFSEEDNVQYWILFMRNQSISKNNRVKKQSSNQKPVIPCFLCRLKDVNS
jgi:hypothetical protein